MEEQRLARPAALATVRPDRAAPPPRSSTMTARRASRSAAGLEPRQQIRRPARRKGNDDADGTVLRGGSCERRRGAAAEPAASVAVARRLVMGNLVFPSPIVGSGRGGGGCGVNRQCAAGGQDHVAMMVPWPGAEATSQRAAMRLDEGLAKRQAQPGALGAAAQPNVELAKGLEGLGAGPVCGDAGADRPRPETRQPAGASKLGAELEPAAGGGEFSPHWRRRAGDGLAKPVVPARSGGRNGWCGRRRAGTPRWW